MKRIAAWYFSTTGNTRHLAQRAKSALEAATEGRTGQGWADARIEVTLVDMVPLCRHLSLVAQGKEELDVSRFPVADGYIFASMTYCMRIPHIVESVLKAIPAEHLAGKPFFCVSSHAGQSCYVVREMFLIASKKGGLSAGTVDVRSPSDWFPGVSCRADAQWDRSALEAFDARIAALPSVFDAVVSTQKPVNDCKLKAMFAVLNLTSDKLFASPMKSMVWHEDKCIHCNLCVNRCPGNALEFVAKEASGADGAPAPVKLVINNDQCVGCLMCINNCPKRAIDNKASAKYDKLYRFSESALPK